MEHSEFRQHIVRGSICLCEKQIYENQEEYNHKNQPITTLYYAADCGIMPFHVSRT